MKPAGQRAIRSHRAGRRGNSPEQSTDATLRSATSVFRLIVHFSFCTASLFLGFRLSRESLLVVVNLKNSEAQLISNSMPAAQSGFTKMLSKVNTTRVKLAEEELLPIAETWKPSGLHHEEGVKSGRVSVGRHQILIRPWPYPDPEEIMKAHMIIARVQQEQRRLYGIVERRQPLIVITPTYRRAFQMVHLSSVMRTLMLVPGQLTWIVIEAGGRSKETAEIISNSGLNIHHLHLTQPMPPDWNKRQQMESLLRFRGLRFVREVRLEGVVIFADESNSHRLQLFDEAQRVQWFGAFSVGLIVPPKKYERGESPLRWGRSASSRITPVQGPACNASGYLVGWFYEYGTVAPENDKNRTSEGFEWAGFVFNAAVLYDTDFRPSWIRDWDEWANPNDDLRSPTVMVSDERFIEPLGDCGRDVLVWWTRSEARSDGKYIEGWVLANQLEVVVPAKRSPWPDPPLPVPPPPAMKAPVDQELHEKKRQGRHRNQGKKNPRKEDS